MVASNLVEPASRPPRSMFSVRPALPLLSALIFVLFLPAGHSRAAQPPVVLLTRADALPLSIDPAIQFRKTKTYFLESPEVTGIKTGATTEEQSLAFERRRLLYGAITGSDTRDRFGNYYTFFWRAARPADLTLRFEYRQQKIGGLIQAREVDYPSARGSHVTRVNITGDDYREQGRVSAWRVLLIENHRAVVALGQSYLWR